MYKKQMRVGLRIFRSLYGYMVGMAVEVAAIFVLMGIGLLITILFFYFWE